MSGDEEGYNGWANYPTWAVNLWLSNDEALWSETTERVAQALGDPQTAADGLRAWVREELAPDLGASFASDLLGYALDLVDWREIADAWLSA